MSDIIRQIGKLEVIKIYKYLVFLVLISIIFLDKHYMNYNDITVRLKRIYASIDSKNKYGAEVLIGTQSTTIKKLGNIHEVSVTFGKEEDSLNKIHSIVSNLANLKDILKDYMEKQGKNKKLIEDEINKSSVLQLILDLSNQEKHGYPLTITRRSKKDPQIKNVRSSLIPTSKPDNIRYSASDDSAVLNMMISVSADIVDFNQQHILTFDELINQTIKEWEDIIRKFQII